MSSSWGPDDGADVAAAYAFPAELLQLVLAEFLEDRRLTKAADAVYRNALSATLLGGGPEGAPLAAASFRGSPVLLQRYLDFIRRSYVRLLHLSLPASSFKPSCSLGRPGMSPLLWPLCAVQGIAAWRACFQEVSQLDRCGWEVFVAQAETEWRLCCSEIHALAALKKGALRFRTHPQFIAAYADLLLDMRHLDGQSAFSRIKGLASMHKKETEGFTLLKSTGV